MIRIIQATKIQIDELLPLFDQYRIFYKQASDLAGGRHFLMHRFLNNESVIFMAVEDGIGVGFTQLYKSFSSVSMQGIYILNDLFVAKTHRNRGVGAKLLQKAQQYCLENECKGLALETAVDNPAQHLYERLGWEKDSQCFHYFWRAT